MTSFVYLESTTTLARSSLNHNSMRTPAKTSPKSIFEVQSALVKLSVKDRRPTRKRSLSCIIIDNESQNDRPAMRKRSVSFIIVDDEPQIGRDQEQAVPRAFNARSLKSSKMPVAQQHTASNTSPDQRDLFAATDEAFKRINQPLGEISTPTRASRSIKNLSAYSRSSSRTLSAGEEDYIHLTSSPEPNSSRRADCNFQPPTSNCDESSRSKAFSSDPYLQDHPSKRPRNSEQIVDPSFAQAFSRPMFLGHTDLVETDENGIFSAEDYLTDAEFEQNFNGIFCRERDSLSMDVPVPTPLLQHHPIKSMGKKPQIPDPNTTQGPRSADSRAINLIEIDDDVWGDLEIERNYHELVEGARYPGAKDTDQGIFKPDDYLTDAQLERKLKMWILEHQAEQRQKFINKLQEVPRTTVPSVQIGGSTLAPCKTVELKNGTFLWIDRILQERDGTFALRGRSLVRSTDKGFPFPRKVNELVWVVETSEKQLQAGVTFVPRDVALCQVRKVRQLTFTNQQYPTTSSRDTNERFKSMEQLREEGHLFCRWKHTTIPARASRSIEQSIEHITFAEADEKSRVKCINPRAKPENIRFLWRGEATKLGGSHSAKRMMFNLEGKMEYEYIQQFTLGDSFCGAGGASRGAHDAGTYILWGFDKEPKAIASYKLNFQQLGTNCINMAVDEFIQGKTIVRKIVDFLHISPPCQPFSAAHTVASQVNDERNQAALFSVHHLLETTKPRIVTLEETEGLLSRHKPFFFCLVNIFLSLGYSVRWANLNLAFWGVAQKRMRLCIIASGPGDSLPPLPEPTHGEPGSGLKPFLTISKAIEDIPRTATHNQKKPRFATFKAPKISFSGNMFAKTVTCGGGAGNYHPSGLRNYTAREKGMLQTLPVCHQFAGCYTEVSRQIGNMVPPAFAKELYKAIIKFAKASDQQEAAVIED